MKWQAAGWSYLAAWPSALRPDDLWHLLILGCCSLLALAIGWRSCERVLLRYLRDLANTARRLGNGDLSARPRLKPGYGELGLLASAFSEVAERLQTKQSRIEYLATRDGLTGLPNRSLLIDQVDCAIAMAAQDDQALALAVLDLDRFKFLSDSLGAPQPTIC